MGIVFDGLACDSGVGAGDNPRPIDRRARFKRTGCSRKRLKYRPAFCLQRSVEQKRKEVFRALVKVTSMVFEPLRLRMPAVLGEKPLVFARIKGSALLGVAHPFAEEGALLTRAICAQIDGQLIADRVTVDRQQLLEYP